MAVKALKPGTTVRLIQPVIEGVVVKPNVTDEDFGYMVDYKDAQGVEHHRFFSTDQLEVVKEPLSEAPEAPAEEAPAA